MKSLKLLNIEIHPQSTTSILEQIKKNIALRSGFTHIVSINPEIIMAAQASREFKEVIETAQIQIVDGIGILWAGKLLFDTKIDRLQGVDLMSTIVNMSGEKSLRIMLIGGSGNVAKELAECYSKKYAHSQFLGVEGIKDIKNPQKNEEKELFAIVTAFMPHIVFVSFGSPAQEIWIKRNQAQFQGAICMGVGGAFDFLSGRVVRAPRFIRQMGMEWLFRLIIQPWRLRRQINLLIFIGHILKQRIWGS